MKKIRSSRLLSLVAVALGFVLLIILMGAWRGIRWWEWAHYDKPVWSPDGSKILYQFGGQAAENDQLVIVRRVSRFLAPRTHTIDVPDTLLELPAWRSESEISLFSNEVSQGPGPPSPYYTIDEPVTLLLYDLETKNWQRFQAPLPLATGIDWHPSGAFALISLQDTPSYTPEIAVPGVYKFMPEQGVFELWREAEEPYNIRFSPDGRSVAFFNYIQRGSETEPRLAEVQLLIVDAETKQTLVTHLLANEGPPREWSADGYAGLSWSPEGEWLLMSGDMIEFENQRVYDVLSGFLIVPATGTQNAIFWEMGFNPVDIDLSPSGKEIVVTTVTEPFIGKNTIHILKVPDRFR